VTDALDPLALRQRYDRELRTRVPDKLPDGLIVDHIGPLTRWIDPDERGFLSYRDLGDITDAELDALIAGQRDFFAARGQGVEWKLHGHDRPDDLADRLRAAGFVPEDRETVVIGPAAPLTAGEDPAGLTLRTVTERADLERIAAMEEAVWGEPRPWFVEGMLKELAADPDGTTVVVVEDADRVVSAGWVRYVRGTAFATLWGGATLPGYRNRGCYHALLRYRARLALDRGYSLLQVDASDDSRPILRRLGFEELATTTPFMHPGAG
jgi:GNAT superfamily N-acetyltransferase